MSNLSTDNDRDVAQAARAVHESFKRTPLRMGGCGGLAGGAVLELGGGGGGGTSGSGMYVSSGSVGGGGSHPFGGLTARLAAPGGTVPTSSSGGDASTGGLAASTASSGAGAGGSLFGGGGAGAPVGTELGESLWDPVLSDAAKEEGEADMVFCQVRARPGAGGALAPLQGTAAGSKCVAVARPPVRGWEAVVPRPPQ